MMQRGIKSMIIAEIFPLHNAAGSQTNFPTAFCSGESNLSAALCSGESNLAPALCSGESNLSDA
jgi:hypothetical protein